MLPQPDAMNSSTNWRAATIEDLWDQPVVAGAKETVGGQILAALRPGGEIRNQLEDLANEFPEPGSKDDRVYKGGIYLGTVHSRAAYVAGFLPPFRAGGASAKKAILDIIHWAPDSGLADHDRDDVSLDTGQDLDKGKKKGENLTGMTTPARIRYVRELVEGSVATDEELLVVRIFQTADAAERPVIYQGVEGHPWRGDWINGVFTADDEIWNALSRDRLTDLRGLINAGWRSKP
jgi:hypothetical protein